MTERNMFKVDWVFVKDVFVHGTFGLDRKSGSDLYPDFEQAFSAYKEKSKNHEYTYVTLTYIDAVGSWYEIQRRS